MVIMDHVYETTHCGSNGHVIYDVTCPLRVSYDLPDLPCLFYCLGYVCYLKK